MDKLLINCSKIENGAAFSASCARLGIEKISDAVGDFAILKLPDKYKKTPDPEMDEYVIRTLSAFTDVLRCQ